MKFYKETKLKLTEIGKIPKEWEVVKIRDLGKVITGTTPRTKIKDYWDGTTPFVTPTDISQNKYVYKTERKVTEKGAQIGRVVPKDSVLMTCIASVGKVGLAYEECITNQQINAIVCRREVDPHYVYYILTFRKKALRDQAGATTNAIVKKSLFEEFLVPIPKNYIEQQKIASILSDVDEAIQKTNEIIQKTQELKKGLMQQLLTKGIGHKEFKDTEIGKIPKEWEVVRLCDKKIGNLKDGDWVLKKYYSSEGIRLLQIGDIGVGEFLDISNHFISYETAKKLNCTIVNPKDNVLISRMPDPIGRACLAPQLLYPYIVAVDITILNFNKRQVDAKFIVYILNDSRMLKEAKRLSSGSTRLRISRKNLEKLVIPFPPLPEQKKIASILSDVDGKIEKEKQTKKQLEKLKRGLMQILLTGKVRVKLS